MPLIIELTSFEALVDGLKLLQNYFSVFFFSDSKSY